MPTTEPPPLTRWRRAAYGLPGLPIAALGLPVYVTLPAYYATELGLGLALTGAVLLAVRAWDVVTDPLVGMLSDRLALPLGRRRGMIALATPLLLLAMWQLLVPPADAGWGHLLVWSFLLYLAWTGLQLPHAAWGAELSGDYHGRSAVIAWREGFVIAGTLAAAALAAADGTGGAGLRRLALALAVAIPVTVALCLVLVPEPAAPAGPVHRPGWRAGLRLLATNRPLRLLLGAFLLNGLANGLPATLFLLYVADVLGAAPWSGALLALYLAAGLVGIPPWLALARRIGKARAWRLSMALACLAFLPAPFLGPGDLWVFVAVCLASGACLGADTVLPASMQADAAELDRRAGGGARTAVVFALQGIAAKLALALAVGLGFGLTDLAGYAPGGSAGVTALALCYGALPVALKLGALAVMARHPADEAAFDRLRTAADAA